MIAYILGTFTLYWITIVFFMEQKIKYSTDLDECIMVDLALVALYLC